MKKLILLLLIFLPPFYLMAQKYVLDSVRPSLGNLINEEFNEFAYADSSANFKIFFDKLDSLNSGKPEHVHIFHLGGSHIQADVYSNKIREYLRNMNDHDFAQRGLIFPFRIIGTNNPQNYSITGDKTKWKGYRSAVRSDSALWGLTGITAVLTGFSDTLHIKANHKNSVRNKFFFDKVRFFTDADPSTYCISLTDSSVVFISDTINAEAGYREFSLSDTVQEAFFIVTHSDTSASHSQFRLMGIELMNDQPGVQYTSVGVNGASFESFDRCKLFETQLRLYKPDLFIISIGTNDAYTTDFKADKFRDYYNSMIRMVLSVNPECAILLTVPNDSYYKRKYPNKNTRIQQEIIHTIAREQGQAVWDFYEIMGGLGSSQKWYHNKLMPRDRIHFTALGYSIKADLLFSAFMKQWAMSTGKEPDSFLSKLTGKNE